MFFFNIESLVEKEYLEYKYDVFNVIKIFFWDIKFYVLILCIS